MITRDYLYHSDFAVNAQNVAEWMTANAAEYFDECTIEGSAVICKSSGTTLMQIALTATNINFLAATTNGMEGLGGTTGTAARRIWYAWKCSHGIMLGISETPVVFITKDAADRVAIAAWARLEAPTASEPGSLMTASLNASGVVNRTYLLPLVSGKTALSPILMSDNDGTVLPYMYFTPYSQYNDVGILSVDGTEYLYSGTIAICDGEVGASGSTDLTNYYTKSQTDAQIKTGVAELAEDLSVLNDVVGEVKNTQVLYAAPMQDATVEGRYMLFAEYVFPQKSNYESTDVTFLVRNRGVNVAAEDGTLRVRLRYGKSAQAFQYAQIYFTQCSGLDAAKFMLCCNNAAGTAQLWLDASSAYAGYIFKVLDMGTSANIVDFAAWNLYSPTTGQAELPSEADGWIAVTATAPSADTATTNL